MQLAIVQAKYSSSIRCKKKNIRGFYKNKSALEITLDNLIKSKIFNYILVITDNKYKMTVFLNRKDGHYLHRELDPRIFVIPDGIKAGQNTYTLARSALSTLPFSDIFPYVLVCYGTSVFLDPITIRSLIGTSVVHSSNTMIVKKAPQPIHKNIVISKKENNYYSKKPIYKQNWVDVGTGYCFSIKDLEKYDNVFAEKSFCIVIRDELHSQDINTEDEFLVAQLKYKYLKRKEGL